jgi:hypothetical protein
MTDQRSSTQLEDAKLDAIDDIAMISRIAAAIKRAVACRRIQIRVDTNDAIRILQLLTEAARVAGEQVRRDKLPWWKRIVAVSRDPDR